ncbi:TetR/AcrR family transcriptional regulator [Nonomuraea sediminis]|uniref:TetR/AcrR family transcriptional regulator n=1 Tax=Nonomuraea sediminis TaxID=2835864 RepID=UPI001BDBD613|nr:TetR/AcrR family transcriptional regulator [Nonomuraea sediminis]
MIRADAARNRRLLLDAAAAEFAENGMDVSIARIAARAGVGKGTVFRHFDSKEQLVTAIFCDQLDGLAATGTGLLEAEDPGAALLAFMTAGVELTAADRSFCQVTAEMSRSDPAVRAASDRLAGVAESLADRARRAGVVRPDVTGHDIVLLLGAAAQAALPVGDAVPGLWRRYLAMIFDGLRAEAAHPLPVPPPTSRDFAPQP